MTVSSEVAYVERAWTGAETNIGTGMQADAVSDLRLVHRRPDGHRTTLQLGLHFNAALAVGTRIVSIQPLPAMPAAPAVLEIGRETPALQGVDFQDNSRYGQQTHEDIADRGALRDAELRANHAMLDSRALRVPRGDQAGEVPYDRRDRFLAFDISGNPIAVLPPTINVSGVPEFSSVTVMMATAIDAPVQFVRLAGYYGPGIGSALWTRASAPGPGAGLRQSADGSWWAIAEPSERFLPQMLGGGDDGVVDNTEVLNAFAYLYGRVGASLRLPFVNAGIYHFNTAASVDFDGIVLDADEGVRIHGRVYMPTLRVVRPLRVDLDVPGDTRYDVMVSPRGVSSPIAKQQWLSGGDLGDSPKVYELNAATCHFANVASAGGDVLTADAGWVANGEAAVINLTADALMHLALQPVLGGQELNTIFPLPGSYRRIVFFKLTAGWAAIEFGSSGSDGAVIKLKPLGQPLATSAALFWPGALDHLSYAPANSLFTARVISEDTVSVLLNGTEVLGGHLKLTGMGRIEEAGFGVRSASGSFAGVSLDVWSRARRTVGGGKAGLRLLVLGDSQSAASVPDSFSTHMARHLEYSFGAQVEKLDNRAVIGDNSGDQLNKLTAAGTGGANVAVINLCTNDIQGGAAWTTSVQNIDAIVDYLTAIGVTIVLMVPWLWYPKSLNFQNKGSNTFNYERGAATRAALLRYAGQTNVKVVDLSQCLPPVVGSWTNPGVGARDMLVKDNLHPTGLTNQIVGWAAAKAVASAVNPLMSCEMSEGTLPETNYVANGWTLYSPSPLSASVSRDGLVTIGGDLNAGTKANGTIIYYLPRNLRPKTAKTASARDTAGTVVQLAVSTIGEVRVFGMAASAGTILQIPSFSYQSSAHLA